MSHMSLRARLLGRAMRLPRIFDRKGTRWLLQLFSPATVIVLVHRGRNSGKLFRTPLEVMVDDPERGEFVIAPMFGTQSDWYRNVVAGGLTELHVRGEVLDVEWRELGEAERRVALDRYRAAHPLFNRLILALVVRVNGFGGDPREALVRDLPMLRLTRRQSS